MVTTTPPAPPSPPAVPDEDAQPVRADNLLSASAGQDDEDKRFQVAEEVSLDQQSDQVRQVGALPPDPAPEASVHEAVATSLQGGDADGSAADDKLGRAIERASPPLFPP